MRLFHYTSRRHLPLILESGFLKRTESNVSLVQPNAGPPVVWLTELPHLRGSEDAMRHGLFSVADKTEVRIEVELPRAIRWLDWAPAQGSSINTMNTLMEAAGGRTAAEHWYVWPQRIDQSRWLEVCVDGESFWKAD